MNNISNRQVICEVLVEAAKKDKDIVVLCSDSRGSASLSPFANIYPDRFIEVGIAEQNLVSIAAGLAKAGKKPYVASPACFLTTRSYEQIKVDVCYSGTNVKLIGISGGVSYGALGMTHHSTQDIASLSALPNMRVYLPSDRHQTSQLFNQLVMDNSPAYIRVGRNPVEDVYCGESSAFEDKGVVTVCDGNDLTIIACGEMVYQAFKASELLKKDGVNCRVLDMFCLKPHDEDAIIKAAKETGRIVTIEEHVPHGGLGSVVCQTVSSEFPIPVKVMSLPDSPVISGNSAQVFEHYKLNAKGIYNTVKGWIK